MFWSKKIQNLKNVGDWSSFLQGILSLTVTHRIYSDPHFPNQQQISTGAHTPEKAVGSTKVLQPFCTFHPLTSAVSNPLILSPISFSPFLAVCGYLVLGNIFNLYCMLRKLLPLSVWSWVSYLGTRQKKLLWCGCFCCPFGPQLLPQI